MESIALALYSLLALVRGAFGWMVLRKMKITGILFWVLLLDVALDPSLILFWIFSGIIKWPIEEELEKAQISLNQIRSERLRPKPMPKPKLES